MTPKKIKAAVTQKQTRKVYSANELLPEKEFLERYKINKDCPNQTALKQQIISTGYNSFVLIGKGLFNCIIPTRTGLVCL